MHPLGAQQMFKCRAGSCPPPPRPLVHPIGRLKGMHAALGSAVHSLPRGPGLTQPPLAPLLLAVLDNPHRAKVSATARAGAAVDHLVVAEAALSTGHRREGGCARGGG